MAHITKIEKEILKLAVEKGDLSIGDFYIAYKSGYTIKMTIQRFIFMGIIKEDPANATHFIVDVEKIKEILK